MIQSLFGFQLSNDTPIEFGYNSDLTLNCFYVQLERINYPLPVYVKSDINNNIVEMYPYYSQSIQNSIKIIKQNIDCKDFDESKYLSWDFKSTPTEIYHAPKFCKTITRVIGDNVIAKYFVLYDLNELGNYKFLSEDTKHFIIKENPDICILQLKDNKLKIINSFLKCNPRYEEKCSQSPLYNILRKE